MITDRIVSLARCPDCRGHLARENGRVRCSACGRDFRCVGSDYLDLRPTDPFSETTRYLDEALHADARHERVSPPLLSAAIRNDMLRKFLAPEATDLVLDLGCGSGRALVWNRQCGGYWAGIDISPHFAAEARADADLLLGDLRRLPFADAAFTKAYSLDVLEHLSPAALAGMLRETGRVLAPGGGLFVYSHVRKNSRLATGLRWINRLARALERVGLIDLTQERLRKSDHLNPLADLAELRAVAAAAGFRVARIRYYTPLVGGIVENVLVRVAERALTRRLARRRLAGDVVSGPAGGSVGRTGESGRAEVDPVPAARAARLAAKQRIARRGLTYGLLRGLTWLMKLDILLFGRIPSGPFFALLIKEP